MNFLLFNSLLLLTHINFIKSEKTVTPVEYEEKWFETKVDHYGYSNNDTFMLRYLYNDKYYKPGGPIFLYPGNEGAVEDFAENTGFIWEFAPQFNALILFIEHRYYGKSVPYQNISENLQLLNYLTIEQAISDYIDLLSHLFPNQKVIAIGGSYGGMLGAWMRMKYPEYITGALASSAPIYQYEGLSDCSGPYNTITSLFGSYFENSPKNIKNMWSIFESRYHDKDYAKYLWKRLNLCDNPDPSISDLLAYIELMFFNVAMVNYPTPANLLVPLPSYPAYFISSFFSAPQMDLTDYETALALMVYFYFNGTHKECYNLHNTNGQVGDFFWNYQYCTQMDMYICSKESSKNMFRPEAYNRTADNEYCQYYFGVSPDPTWLPREFNVRDMSSYSNIIFSNGEYDPWMTGGVLEDINDSVVSIFMENAAHHLDLRTSSPNDPESVKKAREKELELFHLWLKD